MSSKDQEKKAFSDSDYLSGNLQEFSSHFAENKKVTEFPPTFAAIRCKPQLFDIALNHIEAPISSNKKSDHTPSPTTSSPQTNPTTQANPEQDQQQGSGLMSWLGWGK